jgi:hypothetical protein
MPRYKLAERRTANEEGSRAALNGLKNQAGTVEVLTGITVPAFSAFLYPPVLELAVRRGLQPRAQFGRPGSIPGWGTHCHHNRDADNSTR